MKRKILILGASYGSLLGTKLLMAGHSVCLVCTQPTVDLIQREGTLVRLPVRGRAALLDIESNNLPGVLSACTPESADPVAYDLVVLAMQEPQYDAPGVRDLMQRVARARTPSLAIMNMPPLPYLKRIGGPATERLGVGYTNPRVWVDFDSRLITLASPDPQAFRAPDQPKNVLQVGLATNFKAARFDEEAPTALMRNLAADIEEARYYHEGAAIDVPVKLKVHDSVFVPLAKWPMLIAGNYRCIGANEMISIRDAVHADLSAAKDVYDWASKVCMRLGASADDLVPFEKYAVAAESLSKPSAAARAIAGGVLRIERVDRLMQGIARELKLQFHPLDEIVAVVDARLERNRLVAQRQARASNVVPVALARELQSPSVAAARPRQLPI